MKKDDKYLSDEHADYIKNLIKTAAEKDKTFKIFGASSHKYRLNETVSPAWVRKFEEQYQIKLPEEYVFFITKIGNGGASPYYGIAPLSLDKKDEKCYKNLSKPNIYDKDYPQFYKECVALRQNGERDEQAFSHEKEDELNEKFDAMCDRIKDGVLNINTQGCTYDTLLVVNGSRKGEIVYMDWNLEIEYPPFLTHMTFLKWYQSFFEEILAGYDVRGYGCHMLGDAYELMEKYVSADWNTKREILASFFKFKTVDEKTLSFLCCFDGVDDVSRLQLILNLDIRKGLTFFERFFHEGSGRIETAVSACRSIPDEYREPYYDRMLDIIYGDFNDELKRKALFFIESIKKFSAGDLFAFFENKKNSEEIRKTCMYVVGAAKDKKEFVEAFVSILHTMDSEKIMLETLVTLRNVKSEKIAQAYQALIPKYQNSNSFMIVKNMKSYLKAME